MQLGIAAPPGRRAGSGPRALAPRRRASASRRAAACAARPGCASTISSRAARRSTLLAKRGSVAHLRPADRLPEALPDRVVAETERHRFVGRVEHLVDRDHAVARRRCAAASFARAEIGHDPRRHEARHAVDHRDVDVAALAVALAVETAPRAPPYAASMPASRSAAGVPTFCGGLSASPVRSMTPQ